MKSVKYEGVYPYKHNHSTKSCSWLQGEIFSELSLLNLEMDEEHESIRGIKSTIL
jgi:hypothetical protein